MTLRFYSNVTEELTLLAEIEDIDDEFGKRIDQIIMLYADSSVSFVEGEPSLVKYAGISEVRITCSNVFIASTPRDQFLTDQFFRQAFHFDYNDDLEKWIPQIKKVADELNKIPRGDGLYWYMKS